MRIGLLLALMAGAISIAAHPAPSTRPRTGGTLHVEMSESAEGIDPRQWPPGPGEREALERLDSLVFDRLIRRDRYGMLQPALAVSWDHDAPAKRWQFRLREGVKFSDGAPLTPPIAAMALQQLLGVSYDVSATADSVVVQADHALPELAAEMAVGRYFIFRVVDDNSVTGTGPFRVAEWASTDAAAKAMLVANETCWAGRPFVDKIELLMGVSFQQQANAIAFGQADVVEVLASDVRRAAQRGVRTVSSEPVELFALIAEATSPAMRNLQVRQAVSLSLDRSSIADVILQKQGVAAGGLLPNWVSGYAHLFPPEFDLARARDLLAASSQELSRSGPLVLVYDSLDAEARSVADRVAVNLREAGIMVQVSSPSEIGKRDAKGDGKADRKKLPVADLRLVRHRIVAPDPAMALSEMLYSFGETAGAIETIDQAYDAERGPIEAYRVIPLAHVTESFGLGVQVRDWMAPRWGGWDLADVWLGPPAAPAPSAMPGSNTP